VGAVSGGVKPINTECIIRGLNVAKWGGFVLFRFVLLSTTRFPNPTASHQLE